MWSYHYCDEIEYPYRIIKIDPIEWRGPIGGKPINIMGWWLYEMKANSDIPLASIKRCPYCGNKLKVD